MGVEYSAAAFFGTYAKRGTKAGDILDRAMDGRDPLSECSIGMHGDQSSGEIWFSIEQRGIGAHYDKHEEIQAPKRLVIAGEAAVRRALVELGISTEDVAPIGWYFAGSAF